MATGYVTAWERQVVQNQWITETHSELEQSDDSAVCREALCKRHGPCQILHKFSGVAMMTRVTVSICLFLLASGAAMAAPHNRPGLWTVTSTAKMGTVPQLPPQVLEMMKKRGMPGMGQPTSRQICVTGKEPNGADLAARMSSHRVDCTPHVVNESASSVTTQIICHGTMEGTGRSIIAWHGDSHYEGDYSFTGTMHGQPQQMQTHYVGDWVKADCGAVKPFDIGRMPADRPPPPPK